MQETILKSTSPNNAENLQQPAGEELLKQIISHAEEKKAENVVSLHIDNPDAPSEWICICEGENSIHTQAISSEITSMLKKNGVYAFSVEGEEEGRWILIDYIDVIVHIMTQQMRAHYNIEEVWKQQTPESSPHPE